MRKFSLIEDDYQQPIWPRDSFEVRTMEKKDLLTTEQIQDQDLKLALELQRIFDAENQENDFDNPNVLGDPHPDLSEFINGGINFEEPVPLTERSNNFPKLLRPDPNPNENLEQYFDVKAEPIEDGEECVTCSYSYKAEDFFSLKCGHRFCLNCNRDHLTTKVKQGKAIGLPCMQHKCTEMFGPDHIQKFCSKQVTSMFKAIQKDIIVGTDKTIKWCAKPDCGKTVRKPPFCQCN